MLAFCEFFCEEKMNAKEKWTNLMKGDDGNYSDRVLDDCLENSFWGNFLSDEKNTQRQDYTIKIFEEVLKILHKHKIENVLEIGPGWGNYTFELSKVCKKLTCLDISENILNFLSKRAEEKNLKNISFINCKIEDFNTKKFDMVFAYNCFYRIFDIDNVLKKIIDCADKVAVFGMGSGIDRQSTIALEKELGLNVKKSKLNHRVMEEFLSEMGISFREIELEIYREYEFDSIEEAFDYEKRFIIGEYCSKDVENILSKYYVYSRGKYRQGHNICAGLIVVEKD